MREYTKVSPNIWRTKSFKSLRPRDRDQFMYLCTGPNQTSAGCCHVNPLYACADLIIKVIDYHAANEKLVSAGLLKVDRDTDEIFVEDWFRSNPPMNEKHNKGILKDIEKIQSMELRQYCRSQLEPVWAEFLARQQDRASKKLGYDLERLRPR